MKITFAVKFVVIEAKWRRAKTCCCLDILKNRLEEFVSQSTKRVNNYFRAKSIISVNMIFYEHFNEDTCIQNVLRTGWQKVDGVLQISMHCVIKQIPLLLQPPEIIRRSLLVNFEKS